MLLLTNFYVPIWLLFFKLNSPLLCISLAPFHDCFISSSSMLLPFHGSLSSSYLMVPPCLASFGIWGVSWVSWPLWLIKVSSYHACSFGSGLIHSGYFLFPSIWKWNFYYVLVFNVWVNVPFLIPWVNVPFSCTHSSVEGHLGCFWLLLI